MLGINIVATSHGTIASEVTSPVAYRAASWTNQLFIHGNEIHHLTLGCSESFSLDGNVEDWIISNNSVHDTNNIAIGAIGFEGIAPNPAFDQCFYQFIRGVGPRMQKLGQFAQKSALIFFVGLARGMGIGH